MNYIREPFSISRTRFAKEMFVQLRNAFNASWMYYIYVAVLVFPVESAGWNIILEESSNDEVLVAYSYSPQNTQEVKNERFFNIN